MGALTGVVFSEKDTSDERHRGVYYRESQRFQGVLEYGGAVHADSSPELAHPGCYHLFIEPVLCLASVECDI